MAFFGLSRPWIAELDTETGAYSNAFKMNESVSTSVNPEYVEGSLYADNREVEYVKEFKRASVTAGVSALPIIAKSAVFGHTFNAAGEEVSSASDDGKYVGYGFISREVQHGKKYYMACILLKVKFSEGEEAYETKGDSIVLKSPSLSGNAIAVGVAYGTVKEEDWRIKSPLFNSEIEADLWIQTKFGVKEKCAVPVASVSGGEYTSEQSVTLATVTTGAKIRYTTNGTTPSETNGTEYKSAVKVSETTALRAIAYKADAVQSDIMTEEYFITQTVSE